MLCEAESRYRLPWAMVLFKLEPKELEEKSRSGDGNTAVSAGICDCCLCMCVSWTHKALGKSQSKHIMRK